MMFAAPENYALKSNGSSATASSGDAEAAIDGNEGTRWESASTDDETWTLDMGQSRTFNTVKILWEGAYCTEFTISYSADGETWTIFHDEKALAAAGWQTIYKESSVTGRYVQYHGTKRATVYGQSFFEFQVFLGDAPKVYTQIPVTLVAQSEGENSSERALDGNDGTEWQGRPAGVSGGDDEARTFDAWFVVDLGGFYEIEMISIKFEGACSQLYHIDFSLDNSNWVLGYNYVGVAGVNGHTDELTSEVLDNYQKVRYIRFWSTKAATEWGMKIFEFKVFGKEYVDSDDTEKPVMTSAQLVSKTWSSVVIAVAATDNNEVVKFHVVDAAKSIDLKLAPTDGKITVSGLTASTAYNFTITALDASANESENSKSVEVTTAERHIIPSVAAPVPTWPADQVKSLYSDAYEFAPASLNSYNEGWWENPTLTEETVGEDHFLHYNLYRNGMIGVQFAETSVATMEKIHIDVYASAAGSITFRPITGGAEVKKTLNLEAEKWNSFDIDMADFGAQNWTNLFQYAIEGYQAGGLVGEHICVDNVYFYRTTALVDDEKPTDVTAAKVSEDIFSVVLAVSAKDNSGAYMVEVVANDHVYATAGGASGATVNVTVPGLLPNTEYNFSVIAKDDAGNAADPVAVSAKTLAAPAPAPAPTYDAENVLGVFTDIYNDLNMGIQGWYAEPVISIGAL
ncbi:MAG: discoidin domain-containing protein, partial [Paludibacteraceae bacterium]|nr:discoidin domain-containing protein [Paludibacteraceae bacterium]